MLHYEFTICVVTKLYSISYQTKLNWCVQIQWINSRCKLSPLLRGSRKFTWRSSPRPLDVVWRVKFGLVYSCCCIQLPPSLLKISGLMWAALHPVCTPADSASSAMIFNLTHKVDHLHGHRPVCCGVSARFMSLNKRCSFATMHHVLHPRCEAVTSFWLVAENPLTQVWLRELEENFRAPSI